MTPLQELAKIETDDQAIRFAKRVASGAIENPLSKSAWFELITAQAVANFPDPKLSAEQKFSKYIDTLTGHAVFQVAKATREEVNRHIDFVKTAASLEGDEYFAKRAGPASAKMHPLAVDYQRKRGNSYQRAYSYVYGRRDNEALRNQVKAEHLTRTLAAVM
jgi:hypothetical protein